jgi:voltage-gated potassium channel Kch
MKISWIFLRTFFRALGFLSPIWITLGGIVFGLGALVARLENIPLQDGFYFAWVTALTVGYGDVVPEAPLARICSLLIALTGIVLSGIWVAIAVQSVRAAFIPGAQNLPNPPSPPSE